MMHGAFHLLKALPVSMPRLHIYGKVYFKTCAKARDRHRLSILFKGALQSW